MRRYDVAIVGGGIVGLATGLALIRHEPRLSIAVVEKEARVGAHQSANNSGVIHAGIYYRPGSLKAKLCVEGARLMMEFCERHEVPYERAGKVIVAVEEWEFPILEDLYRRGVGNGVQGLELIDRTRLRALEPHAAGQRALYSPNTGIVDFGKVTAAMAEQLRRHGCDILLEHRVTGIVGGGRSRASGDKANVIVETTRGEVAANYLINCAGLYSDTIARMAGDEPGIAILPFRGEYYVLKPDSRNLVRNLIYPVPNPALPFLGVHLSRTVYGTVEAGPNAVLAFAREGYNRRIINGGELLDVLTYSGFRALAKKFWRVGLYEMYRSLSKQAFVKSLQYLVPEVTGGDLERGSAGVRAQAVTKDGVLVDDFHIVESQHKLHILNAPSPAATASLAIGRHIADIALSRLGRSAQASHSCATKHLSAGPRV